jgi:uncharacterized protein YqjF (DUF2071 family)
MDDFRYEVLADYAHRPWPVPDSPWVMRQTWTDLLFAHWRVPAQHLRDRLPRGLTLDLHEGDAWIGVVPFQMSNVGLRDFPAVPYLSAFPELNVRTYVTRDNKPGVFFFSLDAARLAAVGTARAAVGLPYYWASMSCRREGRAVTFTSRRLGPTGQPGLDVTYRPTGPVSSPTPGSLDYFLTERYCLYSVWASRLMRLEILHPRWPLRPASATWRVNTMLAPLGLVNLGEPLLHYAERQDVIAWGPESC